MRKCVMFLSFVFVVIATSMAYAGWAGGPKDFPKGTLCCLNDVCVMTKCEEDCRKIGGKVIKSCEECEKGQPKKGNSTDKPKQ